MLHAEMIRVHRLLDYWKTSLQFDIDLFRKHMSHDRFILRCLHVTTNLDQYEDLLNKVSSIINYFNNKMTKLTS